MDYPACITQCAHELAQALVAQDSDVLLACEPTLEGVLIATGISYLAHADETRVRLSPSSQAQPQLSEQVIFVPSSAQTTPLEATSYPAPRPMTPRAQAPQAARSALAQSEGRAVPGQPAHTELQSAAVTNQQSSMTAEHVCVDPRTSPSPQTASTDAALSTEDELIAFARRVWRGFERACARSCPRARADKRCPRPCIGACADRLVYAAATDDPGMPDACFRYLRLGFTCGAQVREMIADSRVAAVNGLARFCKEECEHTRQFVRFSCLSDGTFAAVFRPKADTIPLVAGHFAARMQDERFMIIDPVHRHAAFHQPGKGCEIVVLDARMAERLSRLEDLADDERYVRALWKRFYDGMALPGRDALQRGYDLRVSWMPKRFWGGLTELDPRSLDAGASTPKRYQG